MKKLGMLGIIGGAALLTVAPSSLQWSQDEVSLSLSSANAGVRRVYHRTYRRAAYYAPQPYYYGPVSSYVRTIHYPYPPPGGSYYLPPFASVSSYAEYYISPTTRHYAPPYASFSGWR
jgi:hypothetical protein